MSNLSRDGKAFFSQRPLIWGLWMVQPWAKQKGEKKNKYSHISPNTLLFTALTSAEVTFLWKGVTKLYRYCLEKIEEQM